MVSIWGPRGVFGLWIWGGRRSRQEELINSEVNSHDFSFISGNYLDFKTNLALILP